MKKLFAAALMICMVLCLAPLAALAGEASVHSHPTCGEANCTDTNHGHAAVETWTMLTKENIKQYTYTLGDDDSPHYYLVPGSYYLGEDIVLSDVAADCDTLYLWAKRSDAVSYGKIMTCNICLNGHKITGTRGGSVFLMICDDPSICYPELNISDCQGGGQITGGSNDAGGGVKVSNGVFNLYGGSITGNSGRLGGGVYARGTFNMYGGSICNNSANARHSRGIGVYVYKAFNMYGGTITGNHPGSEPYSSGGGVFVPNSDTSVFHMHGGSITGNTAADGGGVYIEAYTAPSDVKYITFKVEGDVTIQDNHETDGSNSNVELQGYFTLFYIAGELSENARIGVYAPDTRVIARCTEGYNGPLNLENFHSDNGDEYFHVLSEDGKALEVSRYVFTVKISNDSNSGFNRMEGSGETVQQVNAGEAMVPVVYRLADGHILHEKISDVKVDSDSGIEYRIDSAKQITIYGTPTKDVVVNLFYADVLLEWMDELSIGVTKQPGKMVYRSGESFDPAGMEITAHYKFSFPSANDQREASAVLLSNEYSVNAPELIATGEPTEVNITITHKELLGEYRIDGILVPVYLEGTTTLPVRVIPLDEDAPAAVENLQYTGEAQALIHPGVSTHGTWTYSLSEGGEYTAAVPTATNVGQYTVYCKFVPGENSGYSNKSYAVEAEIQKAVRNVPALEKEIFLYDSTVKTVTLQGLDEALMEVSGSLSAADIGSYTVTVTLKDPDNYRWPDTEDATVSLTWSIASDYVIFDSNGGEGTMAPQAFTAGQAQALTPNAFTHSGCDFGGWNTQQDGSGVAYRNGQAVTITGSVTLYAQWVAKPAGTPMAQLVQSKPFDELTDEEKMELEAVMLREMPKELRTLDAVTLHLNKEAQKIGFGGKGNAYGHGPKVIVTDVKLQFSGDNGKTWIDATAENFPAEGITIELPLPHGASEKDQFVLLHMFTVNNDRLGTRAGEVEKLVPVIRNGKLVATLKGLSPIAVVWRQTEQLSSPPKTGDSAMPYLWGAAALLSAAGLATLMRARRKKYI